jgi:hypothetical protein
LPDTTDRHDADDRVLESPSPDEALSDYARSVASLSRDADIQPSADAPKVVVDLPPAPEPEVPADEAAIAIDDVAVYPVAVCGGLLGGAATSMSVTVVPSIEMP